MRVTLAANFFFLTWDNQSPWMRIHTLQTPSSFGKKIRLISIAREYHREDHMNFKRALHSPSEQKQQKNID